MGILLERHGKKLLFLGISRASFNDFFLSHVLDLGSGGPFLHIQVLHDGFDYIFLRG